MSSIDKKRVEYGDFQTPINLAADVCERLFSLGIRPEVIIEPTCGVGAFVLAANDTFKNVKNIFGYEFNQEYLTTLENHVSLLSDSSKIVLEQADFFNTDWNKKIEEINGSILILGNFPWVTNSTQSVINGVNLPVKSNFMGRSGFDAISGKSNFDISECMLISMLNALQGRKADIAMLVKTSVARKVLHYVENKKIGISDAFLIGIDAKQDFDASVEACLIVISLTGEESIGSHDYTVFESLGDIIGTKVGHRDGRAVRDLDAFEMHHDLLGTSPQKWRSGVKHDASSVMELTLTESGLKNGLGDIVAIEPKYLYPLMKGSDVANGLQWRKKYVIITQKYVGQPTDDMVNVAPLTWEYLESHAEKLDSRGSVIYEKNPRFSIFGVGDYAFKPWRIAICSLYKKISFRLVSPIDGNPVMFDDTVYYLSFDSESEARDVLHKLDSCQSINFLSSLIFWDDKRPIKTSILNCLDWEKIV